ncbi:tetratricopeptide repeat protein [Nostoc sp. 2RC]|uniref:tetratricopeptide repeat protein n=1 Tax=Nostoc sp. 2RC TaxID=2485484 RepID=UPI00162A96B9|nr:tetratricopeptide repeat protein [Nostoc sp. 2RC]MBC1237016.1 tetratricopeptide repeat protein [Nostoc sp. 2RC]
MPGKGEEYLITRQKQIERRQRILTMVSIASFMGSMLFSTIPSIQQALQSPKPVAASVSPELALQQQAKGYELVLQREPENQLALEKLSVLRLKLKDPKGAMEPLEKLVKLHPERQDYKTVLEQIQKQEGKGDSQTNNEPKSN